MGGTANYVGLSHSDISFWSSQDSQPLGSQRGGLFVWKFFIFCGGWERVVGGAGVGQRKDKIRAVAGALSSAPTADFLKNQDTYRGFTFFIIALFKLKFKKTKRENIIIGNLYPKGRRFYFLIAQKFLSLISKKYSRICIISFIIFCCSLSIDSEPFFIGVGTDSN